MKRKYLFAIADTRPGDALKNLSFSIISVLILFSIGKAQHSWSRLPSFTDISVGISWSSNSNSIPDRINNVPPTTLTKSLIIPSAAIQSDESDGYSRWHPSTGLIGDLLWAASDDEVNASLFTGGLFGNYDRGINFLSEDVYRVGAGGTVEDFIMATDTYDQGYHMAFGPNLKGEYLLSDSWYLRALMKMTFSFWHYVADDAANKPLKENAKHPRFFTFDIQAISRWGWNLRMEYWIASSSENSSLELQRFWMHITYPLSRTRD